MPSVVVGPLLRHVGRTSATVWVETDGPCTVEVLGALEPTFLAFGHHYALVRVEGLGPGQVLPYEVRLDGELAWPLPHDDGEGVDAAGGRPPSSIRTVHPERGLRIAFGSCRYAPQRKARRLGRTRAALRRAVRTSPDLMGPDALVAFARQVLDDDPGERPDLVAMLGDQVYADEPTNETLRRIRERRGTRPPKDEVADFEEYAWLYRESWTEPDVRWLLSTVPSAMIFDDHDVHDDWNTSRRWRQDAERTPWWRERVTGALMSYWVYQHLGNLSPEELDADDTYREVRKLAGTGVDVGPVLRAMAERADREADGSKGYRWSFWRDLGRTRLVVLDSRCGRLLDGERRMIGARELAWARERMAGDLDHVLVGSSLPWLMAPALHDVEAWDEELCEHADPRLAGAGEWLRRAADLEHWAAFRASFEDLAGALGEVASSGAASVSVLSGDVHHTYVSRADLPGEAPVHQLTCSPLRNRIPIPMRLAFRIAWSRPVERVVRRFVTAAVPGRVPAPSLAWRRVDGPWFGNMLGILDVDGRRLVLTLHRAVADPDGRSPRLQQRARRTLAG